VCVGVLGGGARQSSAGIIPQPGNNGRDSPLVWRKSVLFPVADSVECYPKALSQLILELTPLQAVLFDMITNRMYFIWNGLRTDPAGRIQLSFV